MRHSLIGPDHMWSVREASEDPVRDWGSGVGTGEMASAASQAVHEHSIPVASDSSTCTVPSALIRSRTLMSDL